MGGETNAILAYITSSARGSITTRTAYEVRCAKIISANIRKGPAKRLQHHSTLLNEVAKRMQHV